jgi:lambda family phage portal protein
MGFFSAIRGVFRPRHADAAPLKARAGLQGGLQGQLFAYDAASLDSAEMSEWQPLVKSPDTEINIYRDRMVARSRDMIRNDGFAAGAINRMLDTMIGGAYRLSSMPDYRALSRFGKGFDPAWAEDFRLAVEAEWGSYSEDIGHFNDLARSQTITQQFRQALGHMLIDGDALAVTHWLPERVGYGMARYATAFQVVDPDRLSNPYSNGAGIGAFDTQYMRGGIELDHNGVPIAYHIRKAHQNDYFASLDSVVWERIAREDPDGFLRVIHHFERNRADQHRGVSVFAPILGRLKMLARYYGVELQAATIASVFGTYVTSPYDPAMVEDALSPEGNEGMSWYQSMRADFHKERKPMLNNAVIPTLAPGEKLETVKAERPNSGFGDFTRQMLLGISTALGISVEQLTNDYSETNYSSARAAIAETERTVKRRLAEFNSGVANPVFATWMDEGFKRGLFPLPSGAPDYLEARTAYSRCRWRGPGAGLVDALKERQASVLGMDAGLTTLQEEAANESGRDYREILEQRAVEIKLFKELGLPAPEWSGLVAATGPATQPPPQAQ